MKQGRMNRIMSDRKKEVVDTLLRTFISQGLSETSVRDLSASLNLQCGGLYTYFAGKDQAVIACAEEAALRVEENLVGLALKDLDHPEQMIRHLFERSKEMQPLMRFLVSVCALPKYEQAMKPALARLSERYRHYVIQTAERLHRDPEEIAPYVYITINTMLSYMLFGSEDFTAPQMVMIRKVLEQFIADRDARRGSETITDRSIDEE